MRSSAMPSNSARMSPRWQIGTPVRQTEVFDLFEKTGGLDRWGAHDDRGRRPHQHQRKRVSFGAFVDELLGGAGLANYEISNWARPGHECRHNLIYWHQQDYRGFGCAAHSHRGGRRWWNVRTPDRYIDRVAAGESTEAAGETLDEATRRFEHLELQLRLREGVPMEALDGDELDGMVERDGDRWVLTRAGRLMQNEIATRLKV